MYIYNYMYIYICITICIYKTMCIYIYITMCIYRTMCIYIYRHIDAVILYGNDHGFFSLSRRHELHSGQTETPGRDLTIKYGF